MLIDLRWFQGMTILGRERMAKCGRCCRMLGRTGKGYWYQQTRNGGFELCPPCHHAIYRRSLRQFRYRVRGD
jgi:hypothetical protein